jgi:hypothetical protein
MLTFCVCPIVLVTFPKATRELRDETIGQLSTKAEETRVILREVVLACSPIGRSIELMEEGRDASFHD